VQSSGEQKDPQGEMGAQCVHGYEATET
jgi:hypothetical protein